MTEPFDLSKFRPPAPQVNVSYEGGAFQFGLKANSRLKGIKGVNVVLSDESGSLTINMPAAMAPFIEDGDTVVVTLALCKATVTAPPTSLLPGNA